MWIHIHWENRKQYGFLSKSGKSGNQTLFTTESFPNCIYGCRNGYVCELPGDWSCKGTHSSISIPPDGNCYVFHHDKSISWFEAYYECYKNNGRLATFKNINKNQASIAQQLEHEMDYWIGLYRYEWRWADSKELFGFSNWDTLFPHPEDSCIIVDLRTRKWLTIECMYSYNFVCLKDLTKCVMNPCRNNDTCSYVDNNYTCRCPPGFTGSHCETKLANECSDDNCRNGTTCFDPDTDYIRSCTPGSERSEYQTVPNMTMTLIIVVVVIATVFLILIISVVCVKKKIMTRKSNDAEIVSRYETRNTPVLDNHIYTDIKRSDNIGADARQPAKQESRIYLELI